MNIFRFLLTWSEVWALLIPLVVILVFKPKGPELKWLTWYVVTAFVLNFVAIFIIEYYYLVPSWINNRGNNFFYNFHSFAMVIFFSLYIINSWKHKYTFLLKTLLVVYLALVLCNFVFWESPFVLSTLHFTAGSIVLLIICLLYIIHTIVEESEINWIKHPTFIICAAVCLYQSITFFIFLFIYPMFDDQYEDHSFAFLMMRIYQVSFVVFCILIAFAFYRSHKQLPDRGKAIS